MIKFLIKKCHAFRQLITRAAKNFKANSVKRYLSWMMGIDRNLRSGLTK